MNTKNYYRAMEELYQATAASHAVDRLFHALTVGHSSIRTNNRNVAHRFRQQTTNHLTPSESSLVKKKKKGTWICVCCILWTIACFQSFSQLLQSISASFSPLFWFNYNFLHNSVSQTLLTLFPTTAGSWIQWKINPLYIPAQNQTTDKYSSWLLRKVEHLSA